MEVDRKTKTHLKIIETAIDLFTKRGSANVSLDDIAEAAGVVRRTLYYHFKNKEALILEMTKPIFDTGASYIDAVLKDDQITLRTVCNLFVKLWDKHGNNLELLYVVDFEDFDQLLILHRSFREEFMQLLLKLEIPILKEHIFKIAMILFRCFLPILKSLDGIDDYEERFYNAIDGLLKGLYIPLNKGSLDE